MVHSSAFSVALVALAASCTDAFVTPSVVRVPAASGRTSSTSTVMSMKTPGSRSSSPFNKASSVIRKALFSPPGGNKNINIGGGGGGMMGGGNGNNKNNRQNDFEEGDGLDGVAMLGVLAALKGGAGSAWDAYNAKLDESPILVKACTSLVGFTIGDIMAQKGTGAKGEPLDYGRVGRMAAFGFLFHGTISHFFYNALDAALPGTAAMTVVQKVFIDQVLWAPIFTLLFFTWLGVTTGQSPSELLTKIKNDLIKGVVGSWTVWPIAHTINFRYVPTEQRLLYINTIQIFYNVYLSIIGSK